MKILAVGGGSGGHVTPVAAVLASLAKSDVKVDEVIFVCDKAFAVQAKAVMNQLDFDVAIRIIAAGKLRRYKHFALIDYFKHPSIAVRNIADIFKVGYGTLQALWLLIRAKPDVVFAKGGYVCLPVGFAARTLRIPLVIHDSDARPGLTSRVLAKFAQRIATGFPLENYNYPHQRSTYTGVPVGAHFRPVTPAEQVKIKEKLGMVPSKKLVVALGGGLGSRSINHAMAEALPRLDTVGAHAVILAGKTNYDETLSLTENYQNVTVHDFISSGLGELLAAADIVVTRASATTLQELAGLEKTVIAVPARPLADQHKNATAYQKQHAVVVLQDDDLEVPGRLGGKIVRLLENTSTRQELVRNIAKFAKPHAADEVARLILRAAARQ